MTLRPCAALAAVFVLFSCNSGTPPSRTDSGVPSGVGLGGSCASQACRAGLQCDAMRTCQATGSSKDNAPCTLGLECMSGNCAPNGVRGKCAPSGTGDAGTGCQGDSDCAAPLKCGFDGQKLFPSCMASGNKDVGATCALGSECAQGLLCVNGVCATAPLTDMLAPHGVPPALLPTTGGWQGPSCPAAKTTNFTALWSIPRDSDPADVKQDFYRLPYPNDAARGTDGKVDFSRHPKDPAPVFGFDVLGRYLDKLATLPFGNAPTVVFRFEGPIRFDSLVASGSGANLMLVRLSAGSGQYNRRGLSYKFASNGNRYVCGNWLAVRPYTGDSLTEGTWAVVLLKGVLDTQGAEVQQSPDFAAMVATAAPSDAALTAAYTAYAPLRGWLTNQNILPANVLTAAVFTVADPQRLMKKLQTAEQVSTAPTADAWVKCGGTTPSPCTDATGPRACGTSTAFDEWHTLVELPVFQQGTAPYLTPAEGGDIDITATALTEVRREKVCAALTVPKGTAPSGGWPVVIYAHGTGGHFRGHAGDGAGALVSATAAVLGFDQVGHGPRRGAAGQNTSPNDIVFNFANPASARGTMAQGAADLHGMTRYVKSLAQTPPAGLPALNVNRLVFWGHSQGATEGALFLAQDRAIEGALMTGASASLVDAMTSKKSPINIADNLWLALSETGPQAVDRFHPVLSLLQSYIDPVDPLHFARADIVVPAEAPTPAYARHVFQIWGKDDTYTARPVQWSYALGAGFAFVGPKLDEYELTPVSSVSGNIMVPRTVTAAMRQYAPDGYDGHFVAFENLTAKTDAKNFINRVIAGDVPTIPE